MNKKDFSSFEVQTKSLKGLSSDSWTKAFVSANEHSRVITVTYDKVPKTPTTPKSAGAVSAKNEHIRQPSSSSGSSDGTNVLQIKLADCKTAKRKTKNIDVGKFVISLRSRAMFGDRYIFRTGDEKEFEIFFKTLRQTSETTAEFRPEVRVNPPVQSEPEWLPTGGEGDYAIVSEGGIQLSGDRSFFNINSTIYESFDQARSFAVRLEKYEGSIDAANSIGLRIANQFYLYLADKDLELLTADSDLRLLCSWPFAQIKCFGHLDQTVSFDFGARSCTGHATLQFILESSDRKAVLVRDLTGRICSPPAQNGGSSICRHCRCGRNGARTISSSSSDSDPQDSKIPEADYEDAEFPEEYAVVTQTKKKSPPRPPPFQQPPLQQEQNQEQQQQRPPIPKLPPHPVLDVESDRPSVDPPQRPLTRPPPLPTSRPPPVTPPPPPATIPPLMPSVSPPLTLPKPPPERRRQSLPKTSLAAESASTTSSPESMADSSARQAPEDSEEAAEFVAGRILPETAQEDSTMDSNL